MSIARTIFPDVNVVCRARVAVGTGALTILRTDNITGPFPHVLPPFRLTVCNGYLGAFLRRIHAIGRTSVPIVVISIIAVLSALGEQRQRRLLSTFGFLCTCAKCSLTGLALDAELVDANGAAPPRVPQSGAPADAIDAPDASNRVLHVAAHPREETFAAARGGECYLLKVHR